MGRGKYEPTVLERARDELFSHIQRCGVLQAEDEQRKEWLDDTIEYLAERYPELNHSDLGELRTMGDRYCSPAIPHGKAHAADAWADDGLAEPPAGAKGAEPNEVTAA